MFEPLVEYGIPFLETFSDLQLLASTLELCAAKHVSVAQLFASREIQSNSWSTELLRQLEGTFQHMKETEPRPGPLTYHLILSLLYSEMGEAGKGCEHLQVWWVHHARFGKGDGEPERTKRQGETMGCEQLW